jgi:L-lactate dehydrogenase (cytochrome)
LGGNAALRSAVRNSTVTAVFGDGRSAPGDVVSVVANIADLRERARRRLPRAVFDYVHGGGYDELTLARNRADLEALAIDQHVMRDVSSLSTATSMVGDNARIPLAVGPAGMAGLTWPNGEVETAKAALAFGAPYCLSTFSICSIEDVARAIRAPFWSQLYMMKTRAVNESLIRRAHDAGCSALVLTLDVHVHSRRLADIRNGLTSPLKVMPSNVADILLHTPWLLHMLASRRHTFATMQAEVGARNVLELAAWIDDQLDPSIDVETIAWVRRLWTRKLILKGILNVDDARLAVDLGADAIVVSNHGGRQLDSAPSTISVLPQIARAVGDRIEVLFDGGIRSGFDIVKAVGRGAHGCLSGRAWLYGLAADGGRGVTCALSLLERELRDCMALSGLTQLREIPEGAVFVAPRS